MSENKQVTDAEIKERGAALQGGITELSDDDVDAVAGGTGTDSNDYTDYCDACSGGGKTMSRKEGSNEVQLICRNCGKIYATCPVCGKSWRPTTRMETGGLFKCAGGHTFIAYWA